MPLEIKYGDKTDLMNYVLLTPDGNYVKDFYCPVCGYKDPRASPGGLNFHLGKGDEVHNAARASGKIRQLSIDEVHYLNGLPRAPR